MHQVRRSGEPEEQNNVTTTGPFTLTCDSSHLNVVVNEDEDDHVVGLAAAVFTTPPPRIRPT